MTEQEFATVRLAAFLGAAVVAFTLERLVPHQRLRGNGATNVAMWSVGVIITGLVCGACAFSAARWAQTTGIGLLPALGVPGWMNVAVCVLALDLLSYGWHRANHQILALWRFHQVHHSDGVFNAFTALRFHPGELLLAVPVRLAATVALGASVQGVILFEVLFTLANLIEHGDIDLPATMEARLGRVFIVPATHRWHHCRRWSELNTNFGTIFVLWDRLFGTYRRNASSVRVQTGLPGIAQSPSLLEALAMPAKVIGRGRVT
jgi:sterol desaturase/sphingolipid hydroxylase (fatty acid hydroxylase superfamily)